MEFIKVQETITKRLRDGLEGITYVFELLEEEIKPNAEINKEIISLQAIFNKVGKERRLNVLNKREFDGEIIEIGNRLFDINRSLKQTDLKISQKVEQQSTYNINRLIRDRLFNDAVNKLQIIIEEPNFNKTDKKYQLKILHKQVSVLRNVGKKQEAKIRVEQALKLKKDYVPALHEKAMILQEQGDYEEAIKILIQINELKPNDIQSLNQLAICYREFGDVNKALDIIHQGLLLQPSNNYLHFNQLLIYLFFEPNSQKALDVIQNYFVAFQEPLIRSNGVREKYTNYAQNLDNIWANKETDLRSSYILEAKKYKADWKIKELINAGNIDIENQEEKKDNLINSSTPNANITSVKNQIIGNNEAEPALFQSLTYALTGFKIQNYQAIESIEWSLDNKSEVFANKWIFFTGENGFGKTSILQALALGFLQQATALSEDELSLDRKPHVEVRFWNNNIRKVIKTQFKQGNKDKIIPYQLACFGASRLKSIPINSVNTTPGETIRALFDSDYSLLRLDTIIKDFYRIKDNEDHPQNNRFGQLLKLLQKLLPNLSDISVSEETGELLFTEKEMSDDGQNYPLEPIPFKLLASGIKSIYNLVSDMMIRLCGGKLSELKPESMEGVVIIDEFDLHLHPQWLRSLPMILSDMFPKVQFIVSTHSVEPILGAPEGSVFLNVSRTAEKGVQIEKFDFDMRNLTANLILSGLFNVDISSIQNQNPSDIDTADTMQISQKHKANIEFLKKYYRTK